MSLAWERNADGCSCRKDDLPDYPIIGESTHGILVIREGPFVVSLGEDPKTTDRPS